MSLFFLKKNILGNYISKRLCKFFLLNCVMQQFIYAQRFSFDKEQQQQQQTAFQKKRVKAGAAAAALVDYKVFIKDLKVIHPSEKFP